MNFGKNDIKIYVLVILIYQILLENASCQSQPLKYHIYNHKTQTRTPARVYWTGIPTINTVTTALEIGPK